MGRFGIVVSFGHRFLPSFRPTQDRRRGATALVELIPDDLESSFLAKLFAITWCNSRWRQCTSSLSAQRDDDCRSREVHLSHGDRAFESASSTAESANPWSLMRSDPTRGSRKALNLTPASVRPARSQLSASWRLAQSVDPDISCRPLRSERAAPTSGRISECVGSPGHGADA
jgi:hypothetical protein